MKCNASSLALFVLIGASLGSLPDLVMAKNAKTAQQPGQSEGITPEEAAEKLQEIHDAASRMFSTAKDSAEETFIMATEMFGKVTQEAVDAANEMKQSVHGAHNGEKEQLVVETDISSGTEYAQDSQHSNVKENAHDTHTKAKEKAREWKKETVENTANGAREAL